MFKLHYVFKSSFSINVFKNGPIRGEGIFNQTFVSVIVAWFFLFINIGYADKILVFVFNIFFYKRICQRGKAKNDSIQIVLYVIPFVDVLHSSRFLMRLPVNILR